jgi:hypothetical protein
MSLFDVADVSDTTLTARLERAAQLDAAGDPLYPRPPDPPSVVIDLANLGVEATIALLAVAARLLFTHRAWI